MPDLYAKTTVERIAAAFKASELDCCMWCDEALAELAEIAIAAVQEAVGAREVRHSASGSRAGTPCAMRLSGRGWGVLVTGQVIAVTEKNSQRAYLHELIVRQDAPSRQEVGEEVVSEPTLRKHFQDELDGGAFKANISDRHRPPRCSGEKGAFSGIIGVPSGGR